MSPVYPASAKARLVVASADEANTPDAASDPSPDAPARMPRRETPVDARS